MVWTWRSGIFKTTYKYLTLPFWYSRCVFFFALYQVAFIYIPSTIGMWLKAFVFHSPKLIFRQFSCSVVSNSLPPHGLQHARLPCLSPTAGACWNSCPSSRWCHLILCLPLLLLSLIFPIIRVFSNESILHIRWLKDWSFSFSPSNEYSGQISFRIDYFDLPAV